MQADLKNLSILIVDDEKGIRDMLTEYFNEEGHKCQTAEDGQIGFQKVIESHYDLILMDISMPNMNGVDCINAIRQVDPFVPIIIMTAYAPNIHFPDELKKEYIILKKPFTFEQLSKAMIQIISEKKSDPL